MSIELILATLKDEPENGQSPLRLKRLADVVLSAVRESGGTDDDVEVATESVLVDLPGGTATIRSSYALFPIEELDVLTLRVVFAVAKTGDMLVVTEGGDYTAIVLSAAQRARLPEAERETSPVCRSPKQLGELLESWYREQSGFRGQAVADWSARGQTNASVATPSAGISYSWDPWANDHVPNGPEAELVKAYRFDPADNGIPRCPEVLRDLRDVCERHLQAREEPSSQLIDNEDWPPLTLKMRFYSADIWPDQVEFRLYELNDSVAMLMFEIARTGDMSFILPGGIVLTDPGQAVRVPHSWKQTKKIVSCQSARELKSLLTNLQLDFRPEDQGDPVKFVPGTFPERRRIVYIEANRKETAGKQQLKVYKYKPKSPGGPRRPEEGMLGAELWQLETPAGRQFYAYFYAGNGWLDYLRDFARSEERVIGSIVNFETFVQDDGQRFPLSDCKVAKVYL